MTDRHASDVERQFNLEDQPERLDEHGPLFITGCPRSGTTFLSQAINAVPTIEQFNGVLAPPRMMHMIGQRFESGQSVDLEMRAVRDIFWNSFVRRCTFGNERLGAAFRARRGLLALARPGTIEGRTMLYKEPFLAFAMRPMVDHFAGSRILHIVRDGRDNADSLDRSYPNALSDEILGNPQLTQQQNSEIGDFVVVDGFCYPWWVAEEDRSFFRSAPRYLRNVMLWQEMTRRIVDASTALPPDRFLQVRYDDMVRKKQETAELITAFIGGTNPRPLLKALANGHESSIGIHGRNQPPKLVEEATLIAGDSLRELGFV